MIRFKYTLTAAVEEHTMMMFMYVFAISLCLITDTLNPFTGWLYYLCNTIAFLFGWFLGLFLNIGLVEWMRKRTIWKTDWDRLFDDDK